MHSLDLFRSRSVGLTAAPGWSVLPGDLFETFPSARQI
jgi:hypothetical protein